MQRKVNYKKVGVFVICAIIAIIAIVSFIKTMVASANEKKTIEYRLSMVGYSENEVNAIKEYLNDEQIEEVINSEYETALTKFIKEKYFIYSNLDKYLDYNKSHSNVESSKVVALVNTGANSDWYSTIIKTDTTKNELMLVNKFYGLDETYEPEDLMEVPGQYAYAGNYISESMYDNLTELLSASKDAGYTLLISQGYRSYSDQESAYNNIELYNSTSYADSVAARAGHSEYQTGLSVELGLYYSSMETGSEVEWIKNNAYKYGFIIRYPEGKEDITGFEANNYRLRFVGVEVANKVQKENITFDEYYAYYINK